MAVNHYAPFLLTHELIPLLTSSSDAKVLTVSSGSHYNTNIDVEKMDHPLIYIGLWAYKVSKLANVLFTLEFNRRFRNTYIRAYAVDPGLVNTEIALKGTDPISKFVWKIRRNSGKVPEVPVRTLLYLAQKPSKEKVGEYYWKDSLPKAPSPVAQDPELARRLWERSCKMCATPDWMVEK
jgi:NAD(P)-dependent dehydrogenase (short-subunit alcohol dehydrogenase family)